MAPIVLFLLGAGMLVYSKYFPAGFSAPIRPLTSAEQARLAQLMPEVQGLVLELQRRLAARGIQIFIGSTGRTDAEQSAQVAAGRSATNQSWHEVGRAVDIYVIDPSTGQPDTKALRADLYGVMGAEAQELGFRWLGFQTLKSGSGTFSDPYHIELREGDTYAQAQAEWSSRSRGISGFYYRG